jgi:protein AbiQ
MSKLRLYNVSDEYIEYIHMFDKRVFLNKSEKHGRKYLGIVLKINGFNYFVPLSSPKESDHMIIDGKKIIRKNIIPIIRIISTDIHGNEELKGTLKFSNMIPVPDHALSEYDLVGERDINYKILVLKELEFIKVNKEQIIKNAQILYNQRKFNDPKINYLKNTIEFELLESKMKSFKGK